MKKTVTINLSGFIFHIDEDAHDHLSSYLSKIRGYFTDSEGQDEIMSDIESRIAETFQEKISKNKQVINLDDVESIISVMGKQKITWMTVLKPRLNKKRTAKAARVVRLIPIPGHVGCSGIPTMMCSEGFVVG